LTRAIKFIIAMANVLVFIPPPVEAGEAPIHISIINISEVGIDNAAVSVVLKPAVRVVTDPKKKLSTFQNSMNSRLILHFSQE